MMGILSQPDIERLLHNQVVGRIGCHNGDFVYIVPISYAYDGQYIYCHTFEGLKIDIMRKHPKICFEVDHMADMANWESVIAQGQFEELKDSQLINDALRKLHSRILPIVSSETVHLSPDWPFIPDETNVIKGLTFRILLTEKTGRFERAQSEMNSFF